jgi:Alpha 1,4-glycosyltransferase conserved region/Glycosyltransferase sugar-binding region containing DXD motif
MRSFLDHGHAFHLYSYSPKLEVPAGVELKDAAELLEKDGYFTYQKGAGAGSHAAFSNLFRYKLLAERGGWWVDTDVICLSGEIPRFDEFFAYESQEIVNGAVLFFQRWDPLMLDCFNEASKIGNSAKWGEIGPRLITRKARETGRLSGASHRAICYPIHHREALDLLRPAQAETIERRTSNSLLLHLWNEVLRRVHVAKTMLPPRGSFLRTLADRHSVDGWSGEYDTDVLEHAVFLETELRRLRKEIEVLRTQNEAKGLMAFIRSQRIKLIKRLRATESALVSLARYFGS